MYRWFVYVVGTLDADLPRSRKMKASLSVRATGSLVGAGWFALTLESEVAAN